MAFRGSLAVESQVRYFGLPCSPSTSSASGGQNFSPLSDKTVQSLPYGSVTVWLSEVLMGPFLG